MKFPVIVITSLNVFTIATAIQARPSLALTFAETNKGNLVFEDQGKQVGFGSFSYSQEVISGSFVFAPSSGDSLFSKSLDNIPDDVFYDDTIELQVEDGWRVISDLNVTLTEGNTSTTVGFSNGLDFLSDEPQFFNTVLLFKATAEQQIPQDNELLTISLGDSRSPNLSQRNRWFLTDGSTGINAGYQVSIDSNGSFAGFILDFPSIGVGGTWMATPNNDLLPDSNVVPEPLTLLGAGVAIGFGAFFKAKLK